MLFILWSQETILALLEPKPAQSSLRCRGCLFGKPSNLQGRLTPQCNWDYAGVWRVPRSYPQGDVEYYGLSVEQVDKLPKSRGSQRPTDQIRHRNVN
jgi:hypothetical protein